MQHIAAILCCKKVVDIAFNGNLSGNVVFEVSLQEYIGVLLSEVQPGAMVICAFINPFLMMSSPSGSGLFQFFCPNASELTSISNSVIDLTIGLLFCS